MTDKEKIDVTKCLHFDKSDIPNGCTCYWDGECNHYCYYKQLKRKGQECEKLKQTLAEIKEIAKEQIPYPNFGEVKTMIEIEYDYAGKIYNLEQRMYKILQKSVNIRRV